MRGSFCSLNEISTPSMSPFDRATIGLPHAEAVEHEDKAGCFIEAMILDPCHHGTCNMRAK
uniref:Uncharacterized protein n=1 Tax=Arundo donax TaxID=35708 RepID=A0A0A9EA66_ARUDO